MLADAPRLAPIACALADARPTTAADRSRAGALRASPSTSSRRERRLRVRRELGLERAAGALPALTRA